MNIKKLTSEELETLKEFQQKNAAVVSELGNLEVAKLQMETRRQEILDFYNELKEDELKFGKKFSTKYGAGSINIETGEFTPSAQAEENTEKSSF
jgi:MoaA/NifB/PqqE/SkfB family radical SAM enzyme